MAEAAYKDENNDVTHLDFRKAPDEVPHQRLLKITKVNGTDRKVLNWIRVWLIWETKFKSTIKKCSCGYVANGLPQGLGLGSLLFITDANDLNSGICTDFCKSAVGRPVRTDQDARAEVGDHNARAAIYKVL